MKIGDEVYVHGYVDEIRKSARNDTIIIRNEGGYFGTIENEIYLIHIDEPQMGDAKPIPLSNRVTHIKDEPQTDCDHKCIQTEIGCERTDCAWK